MTLDDVLNLLLCAADDTDRVFDVFDVQQWPSGCLEMLCGLGILREASGGHLASCPACNGGHRERIEYSPSATGEDRMHIWCPESMRVEVTAEMCRGWEINPRGIAKVIAKTMDLNGNFTEIVPSRLWRLGRVQHGNTTREVLLGIGLHLQDAGSVTIHVGKKGRSVVIVPSIVPDDRVWLDVVPVVISLDQITSLGDVRLEIDGLAFMNMITEWDEYKNSRSLLPHDPKEQEKFLEQKIASGIKASEKDAIYIAAYLEFGSYRRAASGLTEQTGQRVTKGQIERAVIRAGGIDKCMRLEDSRSVSRSVPSETQDIKKKMMVYGKG